MPDPGGESGLHVEEIGDPAGPPVLFLHGFMSSNLQWEPNRDGLGRRLRLLLVEQPGHGQSPGPDDPAAYQAPAILARLDRIRSERGIDRIWFVGQSLGGAIAIRYALTYPEHVAGLVFTNSRAVFGLVGKQSAPPKPGERSPRLTKERIRSMPYHPRHSKRLPADLQAKMIKVADEMPHTVFRYLRSGGPWDSTEDLDQLKVPTLLVNGRFEKAFQPCVGEAERLIPDIRTVHLDGGHSVNIDQPEQFNQAVLDFVSGR